MILVKNIKPGKINFLALLTIILIILNNSLSYAEESKETHFTSIIEITVLDKVSSKNNLLKIKIGDEIKFKNLLIKPLKCKNSEFDDNPEVTAYLQVKDMTVKNNNEVFIFNGWTFLSSPSIQPFDHPVYDIWLTKCY